LKNRNKKIEKRKKSFVIGKILKATFLMTNDFFSLVNPFKPKYFGQESDYIK